MTLLLDTHVLLWLAAGSTRLGSQACAAILTGDARVSAISIWEVGIKQAQGRLDAAALEPYLDAADFSALPFTHQHARTAAALPGHHGDPFDRALVAQARVEGLVLVTADQRLSSYDVAVLDATR